MIWVLAYKIIYRVALLDPTLQKCSKMDAHKKMEKNIRFLKIYKINYFKILQKLFI